MIEIKNLHKSFDGTKVLNGISATFERGKTSLVIGQSGSGKTVLFELAIIKSALFVAQTKKCQLIV